MVCAILTYVIVLTVQVGMIRVGIWEGLLRGDIKSIVNLVVFQYHCMLIFWSHFKCMTTEPGVLPKNYDTLSFKKIAPPLAKAIMGVMGEIDKMKTDHQGQQAQIDALHARSTKSSPSLSRSTRRTHHSDGGPRAGANSSGERSMPNASSSRLTRQALTVLR